MAGLIRSFVRGSVLAAACCATCAYSSADTPNPADAPPSFRRTANGHPLIGAAVMAYQLDQPQLAQLIANQFDCLTAENEFKPDATEPQPGEFDFTNADKILAFVKAHDMKMIGHNLCWHDQTPKWMYKDASGNPLPREQALTNLKRHIDGVMGHFKGRVLGWDVVNEAISDSPDVYLVDCPAKKAIGDDYIEQAFKLAAAADPDAELYYNDYSIEYPQKREKTLKLVKGLKDHGCRVDAVGIQGHWILKNGDSPQLLDDSIRAFSALGLKVCVSELDVEMLPRTTTGASVLASEAAGGAEMNPYTAGLPGDAAQQQAEFYRRIFAVIEQHKDVVERVTFWGTHDGSSWLNDWPVKGRTNHPLLWDRQLQPKPAFFAVIKAIGAGGR